MTEDPAAADILESILRLYPDRLGGSLSIEEVADYFKTVHGMSGTYEVVRRNLPAMGATPVKIPGCGTRIWVSHLVRALAKLRDPDAKTPVAPPKRRAVKEVPTTLTSNRGRQGGHGGVVTSPLFISQASSQILVANPESWHWLPQRRMPKEPPRTVFVSELAAVRYQKRQERLHAFWRDVLREMDKLEAAQRQEQALALRPTRERVKSSSRRRT